MFLEHPLWLDEGGFADVEERWSKWSLLVRGTYLAVGRHLEMCALAYGAGSCAPYAPSQELSAQAAQIGATWATDRLSALRKADPVRAVMADVQVLAARMQ